jgi:hypothetical protein
MKQSVSQKSFLAEILLASLLLAAIAGASPVFGQDKSAADTRRMRPLGARH